MHIAPFHFTVDNKFGKHNFLGYLVYKPSRRNKQKLRVYMNLGAGNDLIGEVPVTIDLEAKKAWCDYDYFEMFAQWLEGYGYDEEYFDKQMPGEDRNQAYLEWFFKANGATLRFW